MFNGVGDCLLSNAIKMRGHGVVLDGDAPFSPPSARQSVAFF
jgi:hypothetical protein